MIGGSTETLGAVLLAAEGACGPAPASCRWRPRPPSRRRRPALPEALVRALPETDDGAIRADAADEVRDLAGAPTPSWSARAWRTRRRPGVRRAAAAGPDRPGGPRRARAVLRDRRRRLPAPPERPGGPHAQPDRDRLRAARGGGRDRGRPGGVGRRPPGRAAGGRGPRRSDVLDRGPRRRGSGRTRAATPGSASPGPATCGRASRPVSWLAALSPRRPRSGRRSCTAGRGAAGVVRRAAGFPRAGTAGRGPAALAEIGLTPDGRRPAGTRRTACADNYIAELPFGAREIDDAAFVAPTAVVVGAVTMGAQSSIWYSAVARADDETIEIGEGSNVQDGSTLHSDPASRCSSAGA